MHNICNIIKHLHLLKHPNKARFLIPASHVNGTLRRKVMNVLATALILLSE